MRRSTLVLLVGLLVLVGWAGLATTQTRELVVAAWGDPYEAGWRKSLVPAFESNTDPRDDLIDRHRTVAVAITNTGDRVGACPRRPRHQYQD